MQSETPTPLNIRLTSWEKWGFRSSTPYTREGLEHLKGGGFNGIFVGGGSGMGPDGLSPEMFVESTVIPDLMPESRRSNEKLIRERMALTRSIGLDCWLIVWGIPGPDESYGTAYANNSQTVDRRIKLEMRGLLQRQPDLFGQRDPEGCSWRGNRPLCLSQPTVQAYYLELYANLCRDFPELDGLVFFPGDHNPECCDESCPRCGSAPGGPWSVYIRFLNEAVETVLEARPGLPIYVIVWNPEIDVRNWIIRKSHPACGVILPFPDLVDEQRRTGRLETAQPWMSIDRMGWLTSENAGMAREEGRPILALHEFCQSEVYDPCHAFALPGKTINVLHKLAADDFSGIMDFWGDYPPVTRNANMMAVRAYLDDPQATREELLQRVAAKAIGAQPELPQLTNALLDVWGKIEQAVDDQAYFTWFQRLNAGIGRQGARGHLYLPLIPSFLDLDERPRDNYFQKHIRIWIDGKLGSIHGQAQLDDRDTFIELADESEQAGALCQQEGQSAGTDFLREQALNLRLYASLIASLGRSVWALEAYSTKDAGLLRKLLLEEVDARHEQIRLTDRLGYGINRVLVEEDIQLMLQFLAASDFPNTAPAAFSFSPVPYYD
jgi:hypothetical protein